MDYDGYYKSEDQPTTEDVKFICKQNFPAKAFPAKAFPAKANQYFASPTSLSIRNCTYPNVHHYFISLFKTQAKS
jgi:hypothetical protein